ncbi:hypothetical protein [Absidia glauca]|uniref:ATP-dependent DNA ligase family profile domain-containing protein n=1 Tax=Absidia glauca TaxID=4829 RepID=A0A163J1R4_ABSGL|nr:hypothetical protein [Absidia glauca]
MFTSIFRHQRKYVLYPRHYSTEVPSPTKLLDQLHQLSVAVNQTQSVTGKRQILQQYPTCQAILKRIYDPHRRHFVSSKAVYAYMIKQNLKHQSNNDKILPTTATTTTDLLSATSEFTSLEALLDALSSRQLTGHAALDAILAFYQHHCTNTIEQQMFWRVLDRDLKMGVSIQTIRRLLMTNDNTANTTSATLPDDTDDVSSTPATIPQQELYDRRFMKVSLAATMRPVDETKLWDDIAKTGPCYVSRKLDGVRCITLIQYLDSQEAPHITFCSRTGRVFDTLGKVEQAIRQQLDKQDSLKWRRHDMVLDGEICVYPSSDGDDLESRKEDFLTTMRQIRTLKRQMEHPVYQIFDVIGLDVFRQGKGGPLFQERQQQLEDFIRSYQGDHLSLVQQTPVSSPDQLAVLKDKVARFGWEGLIVRKNVKYEGKRSRNMLKIKEWEDAEYLVQRIETGTMRMPDTGQQKRVMTNVIIHHKGNDVSVGSGFSLQKRLDYANHPDLILGKLITVQYFSESLGDSGNLSLRFPSVKAVYDDGRD